MLARLPVIASLIGMLALGMLVPAIKAASESDWQEARGFLYASVFCLFVAAALWALRATWERHGARTVDVVAAAAAAPDLVAHLAAGGSGTPVVRRLITLGAAGGSGARVPATTEVVALYSQDDPFLGRIEHARRAEAFNIALGLVEKRGWRVLDSVTPRGGQREGRIEAVALTPIMGFREDVSIRIRSSGGMVKVDMRSASRYGDHDFGNNARRIESFFSDFVATLRQR